ncbi:hypothetical protein TW81_12220 [Vibrio galatheae]|uniref:Fimbrial protein n=1 Tax=Vibrio galatheae TaxID=579748 RepID=A0A0F4NJJ0_9VIBR|nr:hypothetical protein TW81_12220 [Vibrio galatheae]
MCLATTNVYASSDGSITFVGALTEPTCNVSINGQGTNATIRLPSVSARSLAAPGETAGATAFSFSLTDCVGSMNTASAFFEAGSAVDLRSGRLINSGTANNVSLQLRDGSALANVIKVGSAEQVEALTYVDVSSGSADLTYVVEYYAEEMTTPGVVSSTVTYSIQYK